MKRLVMAIFIVAPSLIWGCTLDKEYVKRDEATFNAVAPEYAKYFESDSNLSDAQKQDRRDLVKSWQKRIEEGKQ